MYDGILDLLLPVSRWSYKNLGRTWNLVSILTDFLTAFLQNGTTMRGFYQNYQSKCVMKYDMKETDLIDWRTLHTACVEFLEKLWILTRKNTCGPIPRALVEDGIAMEMQISKLIPGEIKKTAKQISKIEIPGSYFRDRMFIKLPSNRNLLMEAAKKETWPLKRRNQKSIKWNAGKMRAWYHFGAFFMPFYNFLSFRFPPFCVSHPNLWRIALQT